MARFVWIFFFAALPFVAHATHNRAGEITYEQIGELTIRATITTYTRTSSVAADRDELILFWGDGTADTLQRVNGEGQELPNDVKLNFYIGVHTYSGRGSFTLSMEDPNRNEGILNVNFPNSVTVPFYLETTFTFLNPIFQGINSSAILLQPPLDFGCVGQPFIHNANAYDPDGDSLAYEWSVPKQSEDVPVPRYQDPDQISPGANNQISLDPVTGTIIWDAPQQAGEYNIAFVIKEYRNGVLLNTITRDMQIIIEPDCDNRPPTLTFADSYCVTARDSLVVPITADDPDMPQQLVRMSVTGGPFQLENSPALFTGPQEYSPIPIDSRFIWDVLCDHIQVESYQVLVRAEDNFNQGTSGLATLKTMRIQVVGPSPQNLVVAEMSDGNELRWDKPYACENTANDLFKGFTIWRKVGGDDINLGECYTDLESQGYQPIAFNVLESNDIQYRYKDNTAQPNTIYCYRVTGLFAMTTEGGQLFNRAHSRPSNYTCANIRRDVPYITRASVETTNSISGSTEVRWIAPFPTDFDTSIFLPPYRFQLLRNNTIVRNFDLNSFGAIPREFSYTDLPVDTESEDHTYRVELYSNTDLVGPSMDASTIFLSLRNIEAGLELSWTNSVPWTNEKFSIWKQNTTGTFDSIGTTRGSTVFIDDDVVLDSTYCYKIKSSGRYFLIPVENIVNYSQESCLTRKFSFPPCAPDFNLEVDCGQNATQERPDSFLFSLSWRLPASCQAQNNTIVGYNIYFRKAGDQEYTLLNNTPIQDAQYDYWSGQSMTGCFLVQSVNQDGIESLNTDPICFDGDPDCVFLRLPNTFTPNGDGQNDLFRPISSSFINAFEINIFNRWGNKVFSTTEVDINWDGTDLNGNQLDPAVYYYECQYGYRSEAFSTLNNQVTGFIELIR